MATDVDVQYFSHLNGLVLGNNWGDLIRLLDTCLVNGLPLTSITSASIDDQGDIHLTLYASHNCMLFQIVELSGFAPLELNGKYRIKGVPNANTLILKAVHVGKVITTNGAAKLASLGYDIVFRDSVDVKRVYRAKDPSSVHPFIRVDETISDGINSYTSSYAKSAMVGLLEHMNHLDDYANPDVLQLPFDTNDPVKNWKITGTETEVVRGWSKWYWATHSNFPKISTTEIAIVENAAGWGRTFTLCGNHDAFYFLQSGGSLWETKALSGAGIFNSALDSDVVPNWFLMTLLNNSPASASFGPINTGVTPLVDPPQFNPGRFLINNYNLVSLSNHAYALHLCPDSISGRSALFPGTDVPALEVAFRDDAPLSKLRGSLKHVLYAGKIINQNITTPIIANKSMYVSDCCCVISNANQGGFYFYLGEIE